MILSSELTAELMSRISYLLAANREQGFSMAAAREYIAVIRDKQKERTPEQVGSMDEAELDAFVREIAAEKDETTVGGHASGGTGKKYCQGAA